MCTLTRKACRVPSSTLYHTINSMAKSLDTNHKNIRRDWIAWSKGSEGETRSVHSPFYKIYIVVESIQSIMM